MKDTYPPEAIANIIEEARLALIALQEVRWKHPGERHVEDDRIPREIADSMFLVGKIAKLLREKIAVREEAIRKEKAQLSLIEQIVKGLAKEYDISVNADLIYLQPLDLS